MSGNSVKWIPLGGMELSAANLAPAEKLRKFGFSLMCCEFGSEKLTKASICIYDVLAEKETPNILLITSRRVLYGWYRILMTGIGADFKVVSGAANEIIFFSRDGSNLYLMPSDTIESANGLKAKIPADFQWDLIVIDDEQNTDVPDYKHWQDNIPWKTERLLVITQFPEKKPEDVSAFSSLVKGLLADEELHEAADGIALGIDALPLDPESPVLAAGDKRIYTGDIRRNVEIVNYTIDAEFLSGVRRRMDIRTGLPSYKYGGCVLEEYDVDELKNTLKKPIYTPSDVAEMRAVDKKLDEFLKLTDNITASENDRAIVYCCDKNTVEFLRKTLAAVYSDSVIKTARGDLFSNKDILRKLKVDDSTVYPKIVLSMDDIGAVGEGLDRINYVINYELPGSPALLERRMTRHGVRHENDRHFVMFRDTNGLFDSRMLSKALYAALPDAFSGNLPARNILLETDEKAGFLADLVADLGYAESYSSEVDNCYDLIKKFKGDYELLGAARITNSKQLAEFSGRLLEKVCRFYGFEKKASKEDIAAAVSKLHGLCQENDGVLSAVPDDILAKTAASLDADPASQPFGGEAVAGLAEARKRIDELHNGANYHLMIKNDIQSLNDCIQYPVLYGVWRYRVREQDSVRSFRDFIKIYNDGI